MRRLGLALLLGGCAHPGAPAPAPHPREPVALLELQGLDPDQRAPLETALCQGLVEAQPGEVTCPDSVSTARQLLAQRRLAGEDTTAATAELLRTIEAIPRRVQARGEAPGPGRVVLHLELLRTTDGAVLARREVEAADLESLLPRAQRAAAELVR